MKTKEGDRVEVGFTSQPAGFRYLNPAWWAYTVGRRPDIELAGPANTKREVLKTLCRYKAEGRF